MVVVVVVALFGCGSKPEPEVPFEQRVLDAARAHLAFPSDRVKDRAGWATDLTAAFERDGIPRTNGNVCAVVATIEQESGYDPDPAVPGIGALVDGWIAEKQEDMGAVGGWVFEKGLRGVLDTRPAGADTSFYERFTAAKTERDLDLAYRGFLDHYRDQVPGARVAEGAAAIVGIDPDERWNPITTAGCMQVKVSEAVQHARADRMGAAGVRDALYTRAGCIHFGAARLLDWEAGYTDPAHRFADFNAGRFASRNAAFQQRVSDLSGVPLALDGDLLRYAPSGRPATEASHTLAALATLTAAGVLDIPEARLRADLTREKTLGFEGTRTWQAVGEAWTTKTGKAADYARMPDVTLASVKLSGKKTTAWFAESVKKRYKRCISRLKG
jgi:hypothetical protein